MMQNEDINNNSLPLLRFWDGIWRQKVNELPIRRLMEVF